MGEINIEWSRRFDERNLSYNGEVKWDQFSKLLENA